MSDSLSPEQTKLTVLLPEAPDEIAMLDNESHAHAVQLMEVQLYRKGEDWIYCSVMMAARERGGFLDTTLEMKAHAFKVAAACPYVREKIHDMYMDGKMKLDEPVPIELPIDGRVLKHILEYIYLGRLKVRGELAFSLLEACHLLKLSSIKSLLGDWLGGHINMHNALRMYVVGSRFDCSSLEELAGQFVDQNFIALTNTHDWKLLSEEQIRDILRRDNLLVPKEVEVARAIVRWAQYVSETNSDVGALAARQESFRRLMKDREVFRIPYQEEDGKIGNQGRARGAKMGSTLSRLSTRVSALIHRSGSSRTSLGS